MKKIQKSRFFNDLRLLKCICSVILIAPATGVGNFLYAEQASQGAASSGAVRVTIKPEDADRLSDTTRMREELLLLGEVVARLENENELLRGENKRATAELIEIKRKFQERNESSRQFQLWLAGALSEGEAVRNADGRDERLLQSLRAMSEGGTGLALGTSQFCREVRSLLRELPVGKVRQAEFQLKLDALERDARKFIAMTGSDESATGDEDRMRTCRILALDKESGIVVLSAGLTKGAFVGMIYASGKDKKTQLRLVSVRPSVAAAVVHRGSIENLTPGMEAVAGEKKLVE